MKFSGLMLFVGCVFGFGIAVALYESKDGDSNFSLRQEGELIVDDGNSLPSRAIEGGLPSPQDGGGAPLDLDSNKNNGSTNEPTFKASPPEIESIVLDGPSFKEKIESEIRRVNKLLAMRPDAMMKLIEQAQEIAALLGSEEKAIAFILWEQENKGQWAMRHVSDFWDVVGIENKEKIESIFKDAPMIVPTRPGETAPLHGST